MNKNRASQDSDHIAIENYLRYGILVKNQPSPEDNQYAYLKALVEDLQMHMNSASKFIDLMDEIMLEYKRNFNPNQPRVPAGCREGGQWTVVGGSGQPSASQDGVQPISKPSASQDRRREDVLAIHHSPTPSLDKILGTLRRNVRPKTKGDCATFVRIALESGGFRLRRPPPRADKKVHAGDYGPSLLEAGFEEVVIKDIEAYTNGGAKIGDVAIIQPYPGGNPSGHMQMYDGERWISDWRQGGFWAGRGTDYEKYKPPFKIYRYPAWNKVMLV